MAVFHPRAARVSLVIGGILFKQLLDLLSRVSRENIPSSTEIVYYDLAICCKQKRLIISLFKVLFVSTVPDKMTIPIGVSDVKISRYKRFKGNLVLRCLPTPSSLACGLAPPSPSLSPLHTSYHHR